MSNPYELVSEPFYLLGSKSILAYGAFKSRIREAICNIRIIAGPDQGIKGIRGPKKFFHFFYTKTCKKFEILTISHIAIISHWSITYTIPLNDRFAHFIYLQIIL